MINPANIQAKSKRLASIDFFRGLTMFLLIGEFTGLFGVLVDPQFKGTVIHAIGNQFHHHPWHGLRFWDLIQPFFMYIVGLSMPFSIGKRISRGDTQKSILSHVLKRSFLLIILGWALYCIGPGKITFQFQNVLVQIGITYLIAFLIMKKSNLFQILFSIGIIILMDLVYRFFPVNGFNEAFTPDRNFGAYIDFKLNGGLSGGHWVSVNAIITSAHTIWGVLTGKLLLSKKPGSEKIKIMLLFGALCLISGYLLDPLSPIIKRISTSSFVLVSGGYSILVMALSYWMIDIKKWNPGLVFFSVVGMNPLFIYLFAHVGGADLINNIFIPFTRAVFFFSNEIFIQGINNLLCWFFLWYICYFLYRKKVFIKI